MTKKEKRISILCFIFSIFLFLCAVINITAGQIGAAIGSLGAGFFYLSISYVTYKKGLKDKENKQ